MTPLDDLSSGSSHPTQAVAEPPLALLEGQLLDQPTFHEIYCRMPDDFQAELIDGVVRLMNMAVFEDHARSDSSLNGLFYLYSVETPGTIVQANATTILGPRTEVQPDSALLIDPTWGGQTRSDPGRFTTGPPELVAEIGNSSLRLDLNGKKKVYEAAGTREYLVYDVPNRRFHGFTLVSGRFEPMPISPDGLLRSRAFPGLWINEMAFASNDGRALLASLRQGLESPEHAAFVERLREMRAKRS